MDIRVLNFTCLNENQMGEVLKWRNEPIVRQFSNNHDEITVNEHRAFVEKLKTDKSQEYYLVNLNTEVAEGGGVIHFNNLTEAGASVGLYKNLKSTMHQVGELLMDLIMLIAKQKGLKTLKLDVLKNNGRALVLYGRYNFRVVAEDEHSYYMEKVLQE